MFKAGKFIPHNAKPKGKEPMGKMPSKEPMHDGMKDGEEHGTMKHMSETHGTTPHPVTGVHGVMTANHGSHAMTHTHHDGGHIESQKHPDLAAAHAHAQEQLPSGDDEQQDDQGDAMGMAPDTAMAGLGGYEG